MFQRAKVEQILETRLPCLGCHVIGGRGGKLGPDLTDVGSRLSAAAIEAQILNPQSTNPDSIMPRVPMPAAWRQSLAAYLSGDGEGPGAERTKQESTITSNTPKRLETSDGAALYARLCSGCHGLEGRGDGPNASYLFVAPARHVDAAAMNTRTDDWLFDIIARGGYVMNRHPSMPPYGELLEPEAIGALVARLRQLCNCEGPFWSRDGQQTPTH